MCIVLFAYKAKWAQVHKDLFFSFDIEVIADAEKTYYIYETH